MNKALSTSSRWISLAALLGWSAALGCAATEGTNGGLDAAGSGGAGGSASGAAGTTGAGGGAPAGASGGAGIAGAAGGSGLGGVSGGGGTTGVAGAGGAAGSSGASGTTGAGGATTGTGGGAGMGGTGGVGGAGGASSVGGQGGTAGGGQGGTSIGVDGGAGAGGTGGASTKPPAAPSTGCGKTNPQTGSSTSPLTVSNHMYYVKLPSPYDASRPYPVLFMFNPTNNPINWAEQNAGYESNGARTAAIRVYPHPQNPSSGWGANDVSFFKPLYDQITGSFCVDKQRVFAAGESSGGDFSSILGCEHANLLRAIAPCATKNVSAYPLDATRRTCTGQVTAIVIHGQMDSVVGTENGPRTRDFYRTLNHCSTTTTPVTGSTDARSNCVLYQGCDAGFPVYWCSHTDPNYSNTNHGWPAFAANMTWSVFSSY